MRALESVGEDASARGREWRSESVCSGGGKVRSGRIRERKGSESVRERAGWAGSTRSAKRGKRERERSGREHAKS